MGYLPVFGAFYPIWDDVYQIINIKREKKHDETNSNFGQFLFSVTRFFFLILLLPTEKFLSILFSL